MPPGLLNCTQLSLLALELEVIVLDPWKNREDLKQKIAGHYCCGTRLVEEWVDLKREGGRGERRRRRRE